MAFKKTAEQGAEQGAALIEALKENPYVQRVISDDELREQVKAAYESSAAAYKRASKAKKPTQALLKDEKLQKDLKAAYEAAKVAQEALRDAPANPTAKRGGGKGKFLLLAVVGGAIALVASSALRDKVLDLLFGPEETFDYVPAANGNGTTAAAAQTPAPNAS